MVRRTSVHLKYVTVYRTTEKKAALRVTHKKPLPRVTPVTNDVRPRRTPQSSETARRENYPKNVTLNRTWVFFLYGNGLLIPSRESRMS